MFTASTTRLKRIAFALTSALPFMRKNSMADALIWGLTSPLTPKKPEYCQMWIRIDAEKVFGKKFKNYFKGTARATGLAFKGSPYEIDPRNGTLPGDIGYKLGEPGDFGHVGGRVWGNLMAENSSFYHSPDDARGVRTLEEFGHVDVWVRLH